MLAAEESHQLLLQLLIRLTERAGIFLPGQLFLKGLAPGLLTGIFHLAFYGPQSFYGLNFFPFKFLFALMTTRLFDECVFQTRLLCVQKMTLELYLFSSLRPVTSNRVYNRKKNRVSGRRKLVLRTTLPGTL